MAVNNHPFPPGTVVGFYPRWAIGEERGIGREPIPSAKSYSTVAEDGSLVARALPKSPWTAAAVVDGRWRYFDFPVR